MKFSQKQIARKTRRICSLEGRAATVPAARGTYFEPLPYTIGIICDIIYYHSVEDAADFVYLGRDTWRSQFESRRLDFFFFVTPWNGVRNDWADLTVPPGEEGSGSPVVEEIIVECRKRGIPTFFISKEDPPYFDIFLHYAKLCDHVFTSAREMVPRYREECGHDRVYPATFCFSPGRNSPVRPNTEREKGILFAGSWYHQFPERCAEMTRLFSAFLRYADLMVLDRQLGRKNKTFYPDEYAEFVYPAVEHDILQDMSKLFDGALNFNTVYGSETMFANRCVELSACAVPVYSNYSLGVSELLPHIRILHPETSLDEDFGPKGREFAGERARSGLRCVLKDFISRDRVAQYLRSVVPGLDTGRRRVLVLWEGDAAGAAEAAARQTLEDAVFVPAAEARPKTLEGFDYVTRFSPGAFYDELYLEDMSLAFAFTDAPRVGAAESGEAAYTYAGGMRPAYRTMYRADAYDAADLVSGTDALQHGACFLAGVTVSEHTPYSSALPDGILPLCVIVPVYGNAERFFGKLFTSLQRSDRFGDCRIVIADLSRDRETSMLLKRMSRHFANVVIVSGGGDPGFSRLIPECLEKARSRFCMFANPEDEVFPKALFAALDAALRGGNDIFVGRSRHCGRESYVRDNARIVLNVFGESGIRGGKDFWRATGFMTPPPAAVLLKTGFAKGIVPGGKTLRNDDLYIWKALCGAGSVGATDAVLAACVDTGLYTVKPVGIRIAERNYPEMFAEKLAWLKEQDLLGAVPRNRLEGDIECSLMAPMRAMEPEEGRQFAREIWMHLEPFVKGIVPNDMVLAEFSRLCAAGDYDGAYAVAAGMGDDPCCMPGLAVPVAEQRRYGRFASVLYKAQYLRYLLLSLVSFGQRRKHYLGKMRSYGERAKQ
ncbi:MAG: glycosyltransferase [Mailhella sp.]|nr:glycosyltransferase [Mailhella sp.]